MLFSFILLFYLEIYLSGKFTRVFINANDCSNKLLENREMIPDSAFVESSYKDNYKGKWARETSYTDVAWCPMNKVSTERNEWLIIDLGQISFLNMIMFKGLNRFGFISASSYLIEYKREKDELWRPYKFNGELKIIKGFRDHLTEKYESLEPSIIARWIKIYPQRSVASRICLVTQIYGCKYNSDILEYIVKDGSKMLRLNDGNYDGVNNSGILTRGLGKLVQMVDGNNMELDPFNDEKHALGWYKQDMNGHDDVSIIVRFGMLRNFSRLSLRCYRFQAKRVELPSDVELKFSVNGREFDHSLSQIVEQNTATDLHGYITVDLKARIGRFVKITLKFRSNFIVLRDIQFISSPFKGEIPVIKTATSPESTIDPDNRVIIIPPNFPQKDFFSMNLSTILLIVVTIVVVLLLSGITIVTCVIRKQKLRNKKSKQVLQRYCQTEQARFLGHQFKDGPQLNSSNIQVPRIFTLMDSSSQQYFQYPISPPKTDPSIYTSLAGSDTESNCPSDPPSTQYYPNQSIKPICGPLPLLPLTSTTSTLIPTDQSSFNINQNQNPTYTPYYTQNLHNNLRRSQLNLRTYFDTANHKDGLPHSVSSYNQSLAICGPAKLDIRGPLGNSRLQQVNSKHDKIDHELTLLNQNFPKNVLQNSDSENDLSHNVNTNNETKLSWITSSSLDLQNLDQLATLSKTEYGSIYLAEINSNKSTLELDNGLTNKTLRGVNYIYTDNEEDSMKKILTQNDDNDEGVEDEEYKPAGQMICIRALSRDATDKIRKLYLREINILLSLNHPNLPSVLKLVNVPINSTSPTSEMATGSIIVVTDHGYMSDMHTFLNNCQYDHNQTRSNVNNEHRLISVEDIMHVIHQVVKAMLYLHSRHLLHRDLAARNILLTTDDWQIKLTDLAICQPHFSEDYFSLPTNDPSTKHNEHLHNSVNSLMKYLYTNGNSTTAPNTESRSNGNNDNNSINSLTNGLVRLPIRWMSWEALLTGQYSYSSDVYSFGVLIWELLTLCRKRPHYQLTNDQIIINCNLQAIGDKRSHQLSLLTTNDYNNQPHTNISHHNDTTTIGYFIELLERCSHLNPNERFNFNEILMFLQQNFPDFT